MIIFCILDGVGWGRRDDTDAVAAAATPELDRLWREVPSRLLKAHGRAVGLPSDADMGNSEVGHNAFGAGRVIEQGAKLVDAALGSGAFRSRPIWQALMGCPTLHLIGLVSDGNVHSHVRHLDALIDAAVADHPGVRLRVHALTDGRDVSARSALQWIVPLEARLRGLPDACVASGGGRMHITMDRYGADWGMVERGWRCHVHGEGARYPSAEAAIRAMYEADPKVNDQWLPAFVISRPVEDGGEPAGRIVPGDGVIFFNFRGDRAIEISQAFEAEVFPYFDRGQGAAGSRRTEGEAKIRFAGMMEYDGDAKIPAAYLVEPPVIDRTVGEALVAAGVRSYVVAETQKFGHVTYFFNGNRSGRLSEELEVYEEVPSDRVPFEQRPEMKAEEVTDRAVAAIRSGRYDHIRLNLANGDMVGHSGDFAATVRAVEVVDRCVGRLRAAAAAAGAVLVVTADHGNADEMVELDKKGRPLLVDGRRKPRTSHSLNPVPFHLADPAGRWELVPDAELSAGAAGVSAEGAGAADAEPPGIASVGATLLMLHGIAAPEGYAPSLIREVR